MSLTRFHSNPLTEFDRLFDGALETRSRPSASADVWRPWTQNVDSLRPRMDIQESEDTNLVTATFDLPGMSADDITIDVHQDRLTVTGETGKSHFREQGGYAVRGRSYGKFSRTLQLPFATKSDDVKAKMEGGVLMVTFPKTTPEQESRRIAIQ